MNYNPKPIDTSGVYLDSEITELREKLAENVHEVWAVSRSAQGWRYGQNRDDARKLHPCLVPYAKLPEEEKVIDRIMVEQVLKTILALGFRIEPPVSRKHSSAISD